MPTQILIRLAKHSAIIIAIFVFCGGLLATTHTVTKTADTNDGVCNADCSLREAIAVAVAGDTVIFSGLFASPQTITLTLGQLSITKNLTIAGPTSGLLTVSGNNTSRVLSIGGAAGTTVSISRLTIASGNAGAGFGGAVIVPQSVTLNLTNVLIRDCTAAKGGGIHNTGTMKVQRSLLRNNTSIEGAGIYNAPFGIMQLFNSTVTNNSGGPNSAGGGILNFQQLTIINSTISHNTSAFGGGIRGIGNQLSMRNTIVAANTAASSGPDVNGDVVSLGNNVVGINTAATTSFPQGDPNINNDKVGTAAAPLDPMLDALQSNGGLTQTRGLLMGSPAVDAGNNCVTNGTCANAIDFSGDQRSAERLQGASIDIGAFEVDHLEVSSFADSGGGTLRQQIASALPNSVIYFATPGTVSLTSVLTITKTLSIRGLGARNTVVQRSTAFGTPNFRVFELGGSITLNISGITIANGNLGDPGAGIYVNPGMTLNLTAVAVRNNTTSQTGGGIYNTGTLNIVDSTINNNSATIQGGGIHNFGTLSVTNSTLSNNTSANNGGAIIDNGQTNLINTTISHNTGNVGAGVWKASGGAFNIRNTIIAANISGNGDTRVDVNGTFASQGRNLIGSNSGSNFVNGINGDIVGTTAARIDPILGSLADNGGPTDTRAPIYPSPAINGGNNCVVTASCGTVNNPPTPLTTDQRSMARSSGTSVDIGAVENSWDSIVRTTAETGLGSIRSILAAASPASILTFSIQPTECPSGICTINLSQTELLINKTLNIVGPGARTLVLRQTSTGIRVLSLQGEDISVSLSGLTVSNGNSGTSTGGGIQIGTGGTSFDHPQTVRIDGVAIKNNSGSQGGGIFCTRASLSIINSEISGNTGGGIDVNTACNASIANTTFSGNSGTVGSALRIFGGNSVLTNVTVSGNSGAEAAIRNVSAGTIFLRNTISAGNSATAPGTGIDVGGPATSGGNNLIGNNRDVESTFPAGNPNANGDRVGTAAAPLNALLGSLANNGGTTDTRALLAGSPALNNGNNCVVNRSCPSNNPVTALVNDQRGPGFPRQQSANVDIGAFEMSVADLSTTITDSPDPIFPGGALTYVITVTNAGTATAQSVALNASPPGELTYIAGTLSSSGFGSCAVTSNTLNCSAPALAVGAVATVQFQVRLAIATSPGATLGTTATATAAADGNPANNSATAQTAVHSPVPSITVLNFTERGRNTAGFTLGVFGSNFVVGSVIRFNGQNRTTTYISASQLSASIPASDLLNNGTIPITVFNPSPGGGTSNTLNLIVRECSLGLQVSPVVFGAAGGTGNVNVDVVYGCSGWTALVTGNWITGVPASGSADASFQFTVQPNGGAARVGSIRFELSTPAGTISDTIVINQAAALAGTTPFDFDGDRKTDIGIFRPVDGTWWINRSSNGSTYAAGFGQSTDRIAPADFTGDGKTDIAFWRPSDGYWFVLRSEDSSFFAFPFGATGDIPAPADYDNDGRADAAVFRPSTGTWYIQRSGDGGTTILQFGTNGDQPVVADYDDDGRADIAIFRPSNGQWWLNRSTAGVLAVTFGNASDKPTPGDFTGDGKADVALWRPSTGSWFVLRSEDLSFYAFPFGTNGDIPAPGDYDGDGRFDATVFRPSQATWYSQRSTAGTLIQQFGANGDRPVANAFVP